MSDDELSLKYEISPRYYGHKKTKEVKIFKCKECKRIFNRRHNLTKHERTHTGEKPYNCKVCHKGFADSSNLTKHQQRMHFKKSHFVGTGTLSEQEQKCNTCQVCLREFNTPDELFEHELKYANHKVYPCETCSKVFHLRNSWSRHIDTHNERRKYHCDMCDKTFSQKLLLEKHRQYHAPTDTDIHSTCLVCNCCKQLDSRNLPTIDDEYQDEFGEEEDHEEEDIEYSTINSNDPKYESDADTQRIGSISKGIVVHVCHICDKVFTYRSLWTRHLKSHSTDSSFRCKSCGQVFRRQYYLVKHRKRCKGVPIPDEPGVVKETSSQTQLIDLGYTRDQFSRRV